MLFYSHSDLIQIRAQNFEIVCRSKLGFFTRFSTANLDMDCWLILDILYHIRLCKENDDFWSRNQIWVRTRKSGGWYYFGTEIVWSSKRSNWYSVWMICVHRTDFNKIDTGNLWIRNVKWFLKWKLYFVKYMMK